MSFLLWRSTEIRYELLPPVIYCVVECDVPGPLVGIVLDCCSITLECLAMSCLVWKESVTLVCYWSKEEFVLFWMWSVSLLFSALSLPHSQTVFWVIRIDFHAPLITAMPVPWKPWVAKAFMGVELVQFILRWVNILLESYLILNSWRALWRFLAALGSD